jgi:hypothetical protein
MSWIKNGITILFSTFIALFCAEILLRILDIGYGNAPLENSTKYHHVHPSNYNFLMHDPNAEYGGYYVYYDDLGFRVRNKTSQTFQFSDEENAIIFLGDSFTEANQVTYDETFVSLVGEELGFPSVNFGVSTYSPLIYKLQIENIVSRFLGNSVILQVFSNDFGGDMSYFNKAVFDGDKIIGIDGGSNNELIVLARNSYLLRFVRKSQLLIKKILSNSNTNTGKFTSAFDYEQNITDSQLKNTVQIIKHIKENLAKQGKKLYVFLIPSKSLSLNNDCCLKDALYTRFYTALEKVNINTIDVKSSFENIDNQDKLFFEKNIHLTSHGHKVIANSIISHFRRN